MRLQNLKQRLRRLAELVRDNRGIASIEMGLITPALLSFYLGTADLATGVAVDRKVTILARSLSDLVAQSTTISDTDMTNIFSAAGSIMQPYSTTTLKARVSAINIDGSLNATVGWSSGSNMTARSVGSAVTIPNGLKIANTQLIWSEIRYGFNAPAAKFIVGTVNLTDQFFARPRQSSTICRPPTVTTCS